MMEASPVLQMHLNILQGFESIYLGVLVMGFSTSLVPLMFGIGTSASPLYLYWRRSGLSF